MTLFDRQVSQREVERLLLGKFSGGRPYLQLASWRGSDPIFSCYLLRDGKPEHKQSGTLCELKRWAKYLKPEPRKVVNREYKFIWE